MGAVWRLHNCSIFARETRFIQPLTGFMKESCDVIEYTRTGYRECRIGLGKNRPVAPRVDCLRWWREQQRVPSSTNCHHGSRRRQ